MHQYRLGVDRLEKWYPGVYEKVASRSRDMILPPDEAIRLHLDYCVQFWDLHYSRGMDHLEGVQQRATKMIKGLENFSYGEMIRELGLFNLEKKKLKEESA